MINSASDPALHVIMYHYVRDLPRTPFPALKAMLLHDFRRQLGELQERYEMATLESSLEFLQGAYRPSRDLCLLTFDDGLKEHFREVAPLLAERRLQGVFFLITSSLEERTVAPVHMNHFLMAKLDFETYRSAFLRRVEELTPGAAAEVGAGYGPAALAAYTWDPPEVASFKYLFNFVLDPGMRDAIVGVLFREFIGPEREFAEELYVSWEEARRMQAGGMVMGGHSHRHRPLSTLPEEALRCDLAACRALLDRHLMAQKFWPFCYPYGKPSSYGPAAMTELRRLGFDCAFNTDTGTSAPGADLFEIRRLDCKHAFLRTVAAQ